MLQQEELYTQKVELLLEMHSKKMLGELAGLKEELRNLSDQLAGLKRAQRAAPIAAPPAAVAVATAQETQAATPPVAAADAQPIDRNGIAPQDVSIEKIFYFGQK